MEGRADLRTRYRRPTRIMPSRWICVEAYEREKGWWGSSLGYYVSGAGIERDRNHHSTASVLMENPTQNAQPKNCRGSR